MIRNGGVSPAGELVPGTDCAGQMTNARIIVLYAVCLAGDPMLFFWWNLGRSLW